MLRTRAPVASDVLLHPAAPRLACIRPAASVNPEPGSNSPLFVYHCPSCLLGFCIAAESLHSKPDSFLELASHCFPTLFIGSNVARYFLCFFNNSKNVYILYPLFLRGFIYYLEQSFFSKGCKYTPFFIIQAFFSISSKIFFIPLLSLVFASILLYNEPLFFKGLQIYYKIAYPVMIFFRVT